VKFLEAKFDNEYYYYKYCAADWDNGEDGKRYL